MTINKYTEMFKNFMSSNDIYETNQNFWETTIENLVGGKIEDWVINKFANGNEIKDGNPLFSCRLSQRKALRIIQDKRNPYSPVFSSWVKNYDIEGNDLEELVIAFQPYRYTYSSATELIERYLDGKYKLFQKKLNKEYNKKTNYNRVNHLLKFLESTNLHNNSWNIKREELVYNQINYNLFKRVNHLNQNLLFYQSVFENKELKNSFQAILKMINRLNNIITLKYSYDLNDEFKTNEYKREIINVYINFHNYLKSYNSTVDNLEEIYSELKNKFEETTHNK